MKTCKKCGCSRFREISKEICVQEGVIINDNGSTNYEKAGLIKPTGSSQTVRIECQECGEPVHEAPRC